jgi:hypothetical protein
MAVALGYPHPDYLINSITAKQLAELRAYYKFEPFDLIRLDAAIARLAMIVSAFGGQKLKFADLVSDATAIREKRAQQQSVSEQKREIAKWIGCDASEIAGFSFSFGPKT